MKRIDISSEAIRVYGYQDRNLEIESPLILFITEDGGHRVQDTVGWVHYVPKEWKTLKWLPKNSTAKPSKAMKDKELIEKAMELAKELDLARSPHYADTIFRLVKRIEELHPEPNNAFDTAVVA